jgi:hypothetical protein
MSRSLYCVHATKKVYVLAQNSGEACDIAADRLTDEIMEHGADTLTYEFMNFEDLKTIDEDLLCIIPWTHPDDDNGEELSIEKILVRLGRGNEI